MEHVLQTDCTYIQISVCELLLFILAKQANDHNMLNTDRSGLENNQ